MNSGRVVEIYSTTIEIPFWVLGLVGFAVLAALAFWWRRGRHGRDSNQDTTAR